LLLIPHLWLIYGTISLVEMSLLTFKSYININSFFNFNLTWSWWWFWPLLLYTAGSLNSCELSCCETWISNYMPLMVFISVECFNNIISLIWTLLHHRIVIHNNFSVWIWNHTLNQVCRRLMYIWHCGPRSSTTEWLKMSICVTCIKIIRFNLSICHNYIICLYCR